MAKLMPIGEFVSELYAAYKRKDGYIMGATGQNPRKWAVNSWWYTQYTDPKQRKQALYWREHSKRVWDCNGLAEGLYKDYSGVDINTKARYNYAQWCNPKSSGMIPAKYRVPGAAVFWSNSGASNIHHVAYLYKPVKDGVPSGDWYLIEARGVYYGVVMTKLYDRKPNFWGWMTKYFDYDQPVEIPEDSPVGERILRNGDEGANVKQMQTNLIRLGYDCGKWGADGDFGDATEQALKKFQREHGLDADGEYGPKSRAAMDKAIADLEKPHDDPRCVKIVGGNCYVRAKPDKTGRELGVAHDGDVLPYGGLTSDNGWNLVDFKGENGWVSGKYSKLVG